MYILSPSLLSADFTDMGRQIRILEENGAEYLHIDVMDGIFVPNISIGVPVVKSIRKFTELVLDVHLMITQPQRYIEAFAAAGADIINIHYEACDEIDSTLEKIKTLGKKNALTIKPKTNWKDIIPYLNKVDMVLVMSVEPGFGGQSFIEETLENVRGLYSYKKENGLNYDIEIDGGINAENLKKPLEAGANVIVAGSAILGKRDIGQQVRYFKSVMEE